MQKYSVFSLIKNAFKGHKDWEVAWKDPTPKAEYDVIIIGGGGHGLATAYYWQKSIILQKLPLQKKGGQAEVMLEEILQLLDQTICMMKMVYLVSLEWIYGEI